MIFNRQLRDPCSHRRGWIVFLFASFVAFGSGPSMADRPSLVDLDGELTAVVDGLCSGDASLCGVVPGPSFGSTIDIGSLGDLPLSKLRIAFTRSGLNAIWDSVDVAIEMTEDDVSVAALLEANQLVSLIGIVIGGNQNETIQLVNAYVISAETDHATRTLLLSFQVEEIRFNLLGVSTQWNTKNQIGSGCDVPQNTTHVDVAANSSSLLTSGEEPVTYAFGVERAVGVLGNPPGPMAPTFSFVRPFLSGCWLKTGASGAPRDLSFHVLSPLSDTFATQLRAESLELTAAVVTDYELLIDGASAQETIGLEMDAVEWTSRSFDPSTGGVDASNVQTFGF